VTSLLCRGRAALPACAAKALAPAAEAFGGRPRRGVPAFTVCQKEGAASNAPALNLLFA